MPFDPNLPQEATLADAAQMRAPLNGLKYLIDAVPAGQPASVAVTFDGANVRFTFGIPAGEKGLGGLMGLPGEDTNAALAAAIAGTPAISNAGATLDSPFTNDPPTLPDMELLRAKINELILALRR